jgi:hypothetical protein
VVRQQRVVQLDAVLEHPLVVLRDRLMQLLALR